MSERMRRVNELGPRRSCAEALGDLKDPRLGIVTVTGVSVSPDLHDGRVFVSVFGGAKKRKASMAALESAQRLRPGPPGARADA